MIRRTIAFLMVGVSVAGLVGCAGNSAHQAISPQTIAAEANGADLEGVRKVWYKLGAERPGVAGRRPAAFKVAGRPAGYADGPFTADVFRVDLDGSVEGVSGGSDAIVRIGDPASWDWQFLAFVDTSAGSGGGAGNGGWRYVGAIDLPDNRVGAPVPETRTLGPGQSWLVVKTYKQAAKSLNERETSWHQVRSGRMVEVLRTPLEGRRIGTAASFDAAYQCEVLDVFLTPDNVPAITLRVDAVYSNSRRDAFPGLGELFRRSGVARYVQDRATGKFTLDPTGSEWAAEELAGLLTESADQFVHNNRVQLVELAQSGNDAKRKWVARLRQDCASPEVQKELTALVTAEANH